MRVGRRRGHGVQRRPTYDPVVTVIDVVLAEINGRRIRGDDGVRANLSHQGDQPGPQGPIVVEFPVPEAQPVMRLDAQDGARGRHLLAAASHQFDGVGRRIGRTLVAVCADADMDGRTGRRPAGQGATGGHVRVVRMGVDGQDRRRHVRDQHCHCLPLAGADDRLAGELDPLLVDVGMGHQADQPGANRPGQHALLSPVPAAGRPDQGERR